MVLPALSLARRPQSCFTTSSSRRSSRRSLPLRSSTSCGVLMVLWLRFSANTVCSSFLRVPTHSQLRFSDHYCQQELLTAYPHPRDHPHQVWCLGRLRRVHLLNAESHQVLLGPGVRSARRTTTRILTSRIVVTMASSVRWTTPFI